MSSASVMSTPESAEAAVVSLAPTWYSRETRSARIFALARQTESAKTRVYLRRNPGEFAEAYIVGSRSWIVRVEHWGRPATLVEPIELAHLLCMYAKPFTSSYSVLTYLLIL
jgi:hypothetical protein